MTAQDLKNAILQLAVQGKLVPQDPNDEPASELLKRIKAEKEQLIKEGKIKKEKTLAPISYDDIPFDIPGNWEWIKLGEVVSVVSGTSYKSKDVSKTGVRILRGGNLQASNVQYYDDDVFLSDSFYDLEKTIRNGDILIVASTGSKAVIGKPGFVYQTDNNTQIGAFLRIIRPNNGQIIDFLRVIFDSEFYRNHIRQEVQGMNINNVKTEHITEFVVPLPPLAEQQRIVAKIEELMPLVEEYGKAEERLTVLNDEFPDKLRKSILQQAIQGKLTERDPADEPASELLKRIRAEKERLIKEGKIKKEKPLPPITEEEMPFEIPNGWTWVRLSDVGEVSRGRSKHRPRNDRILYDNGTYPLIQTGDVARSNGYISECNTFYNEIGLAQSRIWPKGTLCLTIAANIADVGILEFDACFPDSVVGFNAFNPIDDNRFFLYMLMAYKDILDSKATKSAQKNINLDTIASLAYPLPPLAEQRCIVDRVNELLAACDELK